MKFHVRGLDDVFTYPCTKREVREVFGEDVLKSAWLGGFYPDYHFQRRETRGEITGRVIVTISVGLSYLTQEHEQQAGLHLYRVPKADWSDYLHWQVLEAMRTKLRPWAETMLARPENAWGHHETMMIELRDGRLLEHVRRSK